MLAEKSSTAPNSPRSSIYSRKRMSLPASKAFIHPYFSSRKEVGVALTRQLMRYASNPDTVVLSIKPTAIALASEIAKGLELPLDLFLIRSFKYDGMTIGAVTDRSAQPLLKSLIIRGCDVPKAIIDDSIAKERIELETLKKECCPLNLPLPSTENATLILCTDGIQTGQNARNTIAILKKIMGYRGKIILVAGVMGSDAQKMFTRETNEVIAIRVPQIVGPVASWYEEVNEPTNEEIKEILSQQDYN